MPVPTPRKRTIWSGEEEAELRRLNADGVSTAEIARALGRTRMAIETRTLLLGLRNSSQGG